MWFTFIPSSFLFTIIFFLELDHPPTDPLLRFYFLSSLVFVLFSFEKPFFREKSRFRAYFFSGPSQGYQ